MMNLNEIDIHELLPQQEPFVMVGKLVSFDKSATVTATVVKESNLFVDNGVMTASGVIENIAQSCAARIGYVNKFLLKKGIQLGFIGAIRNLKLYREPVVGEEIVTTVTTVEEVFGMTLVYATVKVGEEIIAEASMKIALSDVEQPSPTQAES